MATGITTHEPGALFHGRYRVVRCIKAGGMGAVYEVVDERTDSPRALKVMLPGVLADPDMRARFGLEARVTGGIASDHLVRVSDAGIDEPTGTPFLVMDLLQGEELGHLTVRRGPLPLAEVVLYLHQTALALDKTHAAGIVHRDLKPENLFVTYRDDGSPCVKILDFGIAKVVAQSTARATRAMGTPMYMAPEQIRGDTTIGPRTDLFALGHIAYALLVGEAYWEEDLRAVGSVFPLLARIMNGMPEAPRERALRRRGVALPIAFDAWIARALAARPEHRFERATAQVAALAEALEVAGPRSAHALGDFASGPMSGAALAVAGSSPSSPGWSTGRQGGLTAASGSVLSVAGAPRQRSAAPLVAATLVIAGLGMGASFALRSHPPANVGVGPASAFQPPPTPVTAAIAPPSVEPAAEPPHEPAAPSPTPTPKLETSAEPRPDSPPAKRRPRPAPDATAVPRASAAPSTADKPPPASTKVPVLGRD